jgi:predicted Zn-dependent peptidase
MHKHELLENGLTIVSENLSYTQTVAINLLVKLGSRYEPKELNGISHFLEHMSFKGTKNRTSKQIAEEFELLGAHFNAYTSREHTVFTIFLLKEHTEAALEILADIILNSIFANEEIQRERTVILQEIAQSLDSPDDIVFDNLQSVVFKDQAMGRPITGIPEVINRINADYLKEYIVNHYTASQIIIAIAGNIEHKTIVEIVRKYFSTLKSNQVIVPEKANYVGGFIYHEKDLEQAQVMLSFPGASFTSEEYYIAQLLSGILGEGMSSRLFQEIREKRGLVYSVGSYNLTYSDIGTFNLYAGTDNLKINEVIQLMVEELFKIDNGISDHELQRVKEKIKTGLMASKEMSSHRASELASDYAIFGRHISVKETLEKVNKVQKEDIKNFCKKLYCNHKVSISAIGKINNIMPYEDLLQLFNY